MGDLCVIENVSPYGTIFFVILAKKLLCVAEILIF